MSTTGAKNVTRDARWVSRPWIPVYCRKRGSLVPGRGEPCAIISVIKSRVPLAFERTNVVYAPTRDKRGSSTRVMLRSAEPGDREDWETDYERLAFISWNCLIPIVRGPRTVVVESGENDPETQREWRKLCVGMGHWLHEGGFLS